MRHKIAKRKRKWILKHATIISEGWEQEPSGKRKDRYFCVKGECNGWLIASPDYDELEAYKAFARCVEDCLRRPFERITFDEALEQIKAESEENRTLIEECERKAVLLNEVKKRNSNV